MNGVLQVCRMGVEAACGLLEVAWLNGQVAAVEAALLQLQTLGNNPSLDQRGPSPSSSCQQQVSHSMTHILHHWFEGGEIWLFCTYSKNPCCLRPQIEGVMVLVWDWRQFSSSMQLMC